MRGPSAEVQRKHVGERGGEPEIVMHSKAVGENTKAKTTLPVTNSKSILGEDFPQMLASRKNSVDVEISP